MARPSLKEERTEEILDAFERCVARSGIEGATLERVAEEAGLQRSLMRHYVGNRNQLIEALLDRFLKRSSHYSKALFKALPEEGRANALVRYLFDSYYSDSQFALVTLALLMAVQEHPELKPRLREWLVDFTEAFAQEIQRAYPDANSDDVLDVAAGIVGIYFNVESFTPLGSMSRLREASKNAAEKLLSTLQK
ncbi:MAG: TetR/AcrR family transcriptional regulator [Pseudomonadota bacterium]